MENYPAKVAVAVEKLEQVIALFDKGEVSLMDFVAVTSISHEEFGMGEDNEIFQTTTISVTFKS